MNVGLLSEISAVKARLDRFAKIERVATDEIGWIALAYGCTRHRAKQMIDQARKTKVQACRPS